MQKIRLTHYIAGGGRGWQTLMFRSCSLEMDEYKGLVVFGIGPQRHWPPPIPSLVEEAHSFLSTCNIPRPAHRTGTLVSHTKRCCVL